MTLSTQYPLGWLRDLPDVRDFAPDDTKSSPRNATKKYQAVIADWFQASRATGPQPEGDVATSADLTAWCSPIESQGRIGSCTANAGVGLIEYFERRAFGQFADASRLFLYKVTRNLLGWKGDTGAYLRTTMKAMAVFGVLPEHYYPYVESRFDEEPTAFDYSFAQAYQSISYFRLDQAGMAPDKVLARIKAFIRAKYPSMFGFTVYNYGNAAGELAFPGPNDRVLGGHAVIAIGYDDNRQIGPYKGALKVRNSWGASWGEMGYGWLPYQYVLSGLAVDFWSLFRAEYIESGQFE